MYRRWSLAGAGLLLAVVVGAFAACGDDESDSCPGIICNDCSGSGDCDIDCNEGEVETCVGLQFFGQSNPDDLRCAFCGSE